MRAAALALALATGALAAPPAYDGEVIPRDFTAVHAPPNTLYLPHWGSSSNGIQIQEVKPEETVVKAGDVVAVFRFGHDRAKDHLTDRSEQLKGERDRELLEISKRIAQLETEVARMKLEREKVRLDMLKGDSLAKVKQTLLELDYKQKALETDASVQRLEATREELRWNESVHASRIAAWDTQFEVFESTKARYTVKASAAGRVFYPMIMSWKEKTNRKVRQGDDMNSGSHFLSIVRSDRAQVRFFVPEADADRVRPGDEVAVDTPGRGAVRAKVVAKDFFPQFVGNARGNYRLAGAWEKCFVVLADLAEPFSKIAKKEVVVRPAVRAEYRAPAIAGDPPGHAPPPARSAQR